MKLASFTHNGAATFGIVTDEGLIDARGFAPEASSLRDALMRGLTPGFAAFADYAPTHGFDEIAFLPLIPESAKIFCVGVNYPAHLRETKHTASPWPTIFSRFCESQVGHLQPIEKPAESEQLDFEGELAVIIGRGGRRIKQADALDHVAGYACFNDGSVRDWQYKSSQFLPGKNFERSGAFGPWLTTADEIGDPAALSLTTRVNGAVMQQASIAAMTFSVPALIAYISTFVTLTPGDVIATGTPEGVGAFRTPPVWLRAGDQVDVEIPGVGLLSNTVRDAVR